MSAEAYYAEQQQELKQVLIDDLAKFTMTYIEDKVDIKRVHLQVSATELGLVHVRHKDDRFVATVRKDYPVKLIFESVQCDSWIVLQQNVSNITDVKGACTKVVHVSKAEYDVIELLFHRVKDFEFSVKYS